MNLIYYRGLNCHLASIINITAALGLDYQNAFSTLWSETDFNYDQRYHMYLSKQVFTNLKSLGAEIKKFDCDFPDAVQNRLSAADVNELLSIGMDSFYIPWSPVYQHFHESHYFFVEKGHDDTFFCSDPVYEKQNLIMNTDHIAQYAFEIARICIKGERTLIPDPVCEAGRIRNSHPVLIDNIMTEITNYTTSGEEKLNLLIRLISAMINNRYLFREYLRLSYGRVMTHPGIFDEAFFRNWEAVKCGLYKLLIIKDKASVISQVEDLFLRVMETEIMIAEQLPELV